MGNMDYNIVMAEPNKLKRKSTDAFPGWDKLVKSAKRSIDDYIDEYYMSSSGSLFITLRFQQRAKGIKGTSLSIRRHCRHISLKALRKSEEICSQCGSKRKYLETCCPIK
jgi:hypothetical protein